MKKLILSIMIVWLLAGCGSATTGVNEFVDEQPEVAEEITPEETLSKLLNNGVGPSIGNIINGSWNVNDFAISETDSQTFTLLSQNKKEVQFNNGDLDTWSLLPLFDYVEVVAVEPPLTNPGDVRCTATPWGETYMTDQLLPGVGDFFEASLRYEIIETGYEPIIQFIVAGTLYATCYTDGSDCSSNPECYASEISERVMGYVVRGTDSNAFVLETPKHYVLFQRANNP